MSGVAKAGSYQVVTSKDVAILLDTETGRSWRFSIGLSTSYEWKPIQFKLDADPAPQK
jgi:hypothetical protein